MSKSELEPDSNLPNSYSHIPFNIPPYVLDTITKAHYKDQLVNSNVNSVKNGLIPSNQHRKSHTGSTTTGGESGTTAGGDDDFTNFSNDLYVSHLDNSWKNFAGSIKYPSLYPKLKYDTTYNDAYDLSGEWLGERNLRTALLGSDEDISKQLEKSWNDQDGKLLPIDLEHSKFRSTASYWMTKQKRAELLPSLKNVMMNNPFIPLLLRILIIMFSACALGMACTVFQSSKTGFQGSSIDQQASTIMCIVVSTCAIVYLMYIAFDEYHGKPLGLRNPLEKVNYVLLDTVFIIFSSANLALAFNTIFDDRWVCRPSVLHDLQSDELYPVILSICRREKAMASFLFIVICLWVLTFSLAVTRVIARVSSKE